jgi:hypothetical protein
MELNEIPVIASFREATNYAFHRDVPQDWLIYCTDIKDSTVAISRGLYKQVNTVAASGIMAVLNAVQRAPLPYVFGGDGITLLCPPLLAARVEQALLATQTIAKDRFDLELRVGKFHVGEVNAQGGPVRVARVKVMEGLTQSVLSGRGVTMVGEWLKDSARSSSFLLSANSQTGPANLRGLECRWEPVKSKRGEMVSVLVRASVGSPREQSQTYERILTEIGLIFGSDSFVSPISAGTLFLSKKIKDYSLETNVVIFPARWLREKIYRLKIFSITMLAAGLWSSLLKKGGNRYRSEVVQNSDYLKFDDGLKFVVDISTEKTQALEDFLEHEFRAGRVEYGLHRSESALLTCLIFNRAEGDHLHLIDGANGGYTRAAANLKSRRLIKNSMENKAG